jgi:hypothetical protein
MRNFGGFQREDFRCVLRELRSFEMSRCIVWLPDRSTFTPRYKIKYQIPNKLPLTVSKLERNGPGGARFH